VVFGHNGAGSLRAHATSDRPWANAEVFGGAAVDCRVYAYACETLGENDADAFGVAAVRAGVRVFVGHSQVIQSPDSERGFTRAQLDCLRTSALGAIERFLDGEEREGHLRLALDDGALAEDPSFMSNILDVDETGGSLFFNASIVLQRLQSSLRVYRRAVE
jgi:hypothetical protein